MSINTNLHKKLQEIDSLSVTILMDNITDRLLPNSQSFVKRAPMIMNERFLPPPVAEHGFSALLEVGKNESFKSMKPEKKSTYLFDTGVSENGVIYNADIFGIDLTFIESIILSHGHLDHFTGLPSILRRISRPTKVICHPDAFLRRWIVYPDGNRAMMPTLDEESLVKQGAIINKIICPSFLPSLIDNNDPIDGSKIDYSTESPPLLLITGQIPRETTFEKGFPVQYKEDPQDKRNLIPDPFVNDDQAIIANIKGKGLVIITGCGHAGIINTILYAKLLTGVNRIHSVIGGFHLTGGMYEDKIEQTIEELQKANPEYVIPCHCTGWKAINRIIDTMPGKFVQTSVGTTFNF
jgi:7,8-dihydropterin-6-yl-methyl-4-(beta-D-ribofuranosyl)aminobenzene 5'-phosphate synthase